MCQHEHRSVVRRLRTPPAAPIGGAPLAAHRAEHVAAHDVRATRPEEPLRESFVDRVLRIVEVPIVKLSSADAEWVVHTLVRPRYEPVEGDRHVTGDEGHTFDDLLACEHA